MGGGAKVGSRAGGSTLDDHDPTLVDAHRETTLSAFTVGEWQRQGKW